jgi:hypothetical protein
MSCRIRQLTIRNFFEKLCEPISAAYAVSEIPLRSGTKIVVKTVLPSTNYLRKPRNYSLLALRPAFASTAAVR